MEPRKCHVTFTAALASAIFEWLLIFMLLVYGIFGYIITKFARYCDLPIPCLLCSRIDHIIGSGVVKVYQDMICKDHKLEMSSLVFCRFHDKLVDVRGMCETCLFSFATKDKSNAETYRLLVGKLGTRDISGFEEESLLDDDRKITSLSMNHCSCCNELWTKSTEFDASDLEVPLSREFLGEIEKKETTALFSSEMTQIERKTKENSLVQFGYSELKITSDTDSEIQVSDNDDNRASISNDPFITMSEDDSSPEKMYSNTVALPMESSQILTLVQSDVDEPRVAVSIIHGLEELNWQEIDQNIIDPSTSANPEKVRDATDGNVSVNISENGSDILEASTAQVLESDKTQELVISKITTDVNDSKIRSDSNDGGLQLQLPSLDLVDAYKIAISSKGRLLPSNLLEQKFSEDLKLFLSQLSRGLESPGMEIISPRISKNLDQLLQKRPLLERNDSRNTLDRNESGFESVDFSTVSEVEGESEVDRLKRQLEYDRKFMTALLKELEEERNASAIAANETMAMITRLQEEKASLQMEASQGIRIMEEQAEYDMEALHKLNEIVAEKGREIQDLEAELEYFRTKYPNESFSENEEDMGSNVSRHDKIMSDSDLSNVERSDHGGEKNSKHSWLEIEDEREYISQCLSNLEKKLNLISSNGKHVDSISGDSELHEDDKKDGVFVSKGSIHGEADIVTLGYELCDLSERLQAIEADKSFIERAINTLKNGEEGLIHEIASHLRELRRIGIRRLHDLPKD